MSSPWNDFWQHCPLWTEGATQDNLRWRRFCLQWTQFGAVSTVDSLHELKPRICGLDLSPVDRLSAYGRWKAGVSWDGKR